MAFNFHQLHIFYTVAERGSFSAAAQALHMTQPAVTMQVQSLEDHFGTKLFNRTTKRIELSEAGHALMPFASQGIHLMRETDAVMSRFTDTLAGRLVLGASNTIGEYVLPRLLGPLGQQYPHMKVMLKVMNTTQILDEISRNQLDFGLIEAPVDHPDMTIKPVMQDELKLIVPGNHPLADQEMVQLTDLLKYPFVLREKGSGTRQVMEEELIRHQVDLSHIQTVMELGSTGAVKSAVEAGLGITILSPSSVKHEVTLGLLKVLTIENVSFQRQFYSIHLKSTLLTIPAVTFLQFVQEYEWV
ncbi:selenium metabolism-associated LysR family transcriptional regulator [Paenibacillus nicotianae]|uniref:Selenium metabolism-associated LysR family transcriptional regulator n=1 Tax=Paenibacillus nicotianae TaxID=1526551 RepID=A0ABW4UWB6_9BACL